MHATLLEWCVGHTAGHCRARGRAVAPPMPQLDPCQNICIKQDKILRHVRPCVGVHCVCVAARAVGAAGGCRCKSVAGARASAKGNTRPELPEIAISI
jgi:hypothetical protein